MHELEEDEIHEEGCCSGLRSCCLWLSGSASGCAGQFLQRTVLSARVLFGCGEPATFRLRAIACITLPRAGRRPVVVLVHGLGGIVNNGSTCRLCSSKPVTVFIFPISRLRAQRKAQRLFLLNHDEAEAVGGIF